MITESIIHDYKQLRNVERVDRPSCENPLQHTLYLDHVKVAQSLRRLLYSLELFWCIWWNPVTTPDIFKQQYDYSKCLFSKAACQGFIWAVFILNYWGFLNLLTVCPLLLKWVKWSYSFGDPFKGSAKMLVRDLNFDEHVSLGFLGRANTFTGVWSLSLE